MVSRDEYIKLKNECEKYNLTKYTIDNDGLVSVDRDVMIQLHLDLKIPIPFKKVTGKFDCSDGNLKTLHNSPIWVGGDFDVNGNSLTSLIGSPEYVGGDFDIAINSLSNILYLPKTIKGKLWIEDNPIRHLFLPYDVIVSEISDDFSSFQLPDRFDEINLKVFLKYQNQYDICRFVNEKLLVNEENLLIFLEDIKDGLL